MIREIGLNRFNFITPFYISPINHLLYTDNCRLKVYIYWKAKITIPDPPLPPLYNPLPRDPPPRPFVPTSLFPAPPSPVPGFNDPPWPPPPPTRRRFTEVLFENCIVPVFSEKEITV